MPKPPSDSLFKLIHSLSPTEKRNVTNALRNTEGSSGLHLKLFQAINKMKEFSEAAEIKLRGKKDSTFAARKNYLFKAILKRLDQTVDENSVQNRIERSIRYGQILAERSLLKEAITEIERGEKLSHDNELFGHLTLIFDLKKRTYQSLLPFAEYQKKSNAIFEQRAELAQAIHNYELVKGEHSAYKLALTTYGSVNLNDEQKSELESIINSDLFQDDAEILTNNARILFHDLRAIHAVYFHNDFKYGYAEYKKVIEHIEKVPNYVEQNIYDYLFYVSKVIYYAIKLDKYQEVKDTHDHLRDLYYSGQYEKFPFVHSHIAMYVIHLEIITIFKYNEFEKIIDLDRVIDEAHKKYDGLLQEETIIVNASNVGITWLVYGNPKKAISWFLQLIDHDLTSRQDILNSTCIHLLLALIDLEDLDRFDHYYRLFNRRGKIGDVELWLASQLNTIHDLAQEKAKLKQHLEATIVDLKDKIVEDEKLRNFNLLLVLYWLKAKIEKQSLSSIFEQFEEEELLESI